MLNSSYLKLLWARKRRYRGMLQFESTNSTITPAITLSAGAPTPLWQVTESTGVIFYYTTASFGHTKTAGTGNLTVRLVNTEAVKDFVTQINFGADGIISGFWDLQIEKFANLTILYLYDNNFTGDLSSWTLQSTLVGLYLYDNNFTGDLSSWTLQSTLVNLYLYDNSFTGAPAIPIGVSALANYRIHINNLSQAVVDQICLDAYNNRANFTYATPAFNVGGTNAAPSGIYQDATPPTTGKEYIYKLVNDPDLEGFNKQVWTYTA